MSTSYDPFNLSEIQVWQDEKRYADAVPVELNRSIARYSAVIALRANASGSALPLAVATACAL